MIPIDDPRMRTQSLLRLLTALQDSVDPVYIDPYTEAITEILRTVSPREPIGSRNTGVLAPSDRGVPIRSGVASRSVPGTLEPTLSGAPNRGFNVEFLPGISIPIGVQLPNTFPTSSMPTRGGSNEQQELYFRDQMMRQQKQNLFGGILPYNVY